MTTDTDNVKVSLIENEVPFKKPPLNRSLSNGTRYALIGQGECQVCRIAHQKNLLQKIIFSKPLRRWESHVLLLSESNISATNVSVKTFSVHLICLYDNLMNDLLISGSLQCR